MAVVNVAEDWSGISAGVGSQGRTAQRVFTVLLDGTDSPMQAPIVARRATGIPRQNDSYDGDAWLVVTQVNARPRTPTLFEVTADYSIPNYGSDPAIESPLDQPAEEEWDFVRSSESIDRAYNSSGKLVVPIINSADEPFDPPLQEDFYDPVLRIRRNMPTFNPEVARLVAGTLNKRPFRGAPVGWARLNSYKGPRVKEGAFTFYRIQAEIQFREGGFERRVLDQGLREKTGYASDGKPTYSQIVDDKGEPITEPVLLDGSGERLKTGKPPIWITFNTKRLTDWAGLGI